MRGDEKQQGGMFSYVSLEERVPVDHPLRAIRRLVDQILARMSKRFDKMYADNGRPSIPPERLLRALLLPTFYSIRSERMLMEQLDYNLLFRWFVGLEMDEPVWNHAVYSKNRERLLNETVAREFFSEVVEQAKPHLSQEHFTVDGTMIEAWASQKSFRRKDGGDDDGPGRASFHGEKRTNETHASKTDPDARLYKKSRGSEAKLSVSFLCACVGWRLGCELWRMGSLSHIFHKQGIHIIADPVTEVVADAAYFIEPDD